MSAFYVGQRVRVRLVRRARNSHLVGLEGVVSEVVHHPSGVWYGLDISPIERLNGTPLFAWAQDQLEPATPPGLESLDEINALYEPEPCTADVDSRGFRVPAGGER